jgi:hypothetical protein
MIDFHVAFANVTILVSYITHLKRKVQAST